MATAALRSEKVKNNYHKEYDRLLTFTRWPLLHPVAGSTLARMGFICSSVDDEIKCIFCNVKLRNFESAKYIMKQHRDKSPQCPIAFGKHSDNVKYSLYSEPQNNLSQNWKDYGRFDASLRSWRDQLLPTRFTPYTTISVQTHLVCIETKQDWNVLYSVARDNNENTIQTNSMQQSTSSNNHFNSNQIIPVLPNVSRVKSELSAEDDITSSRVSMNRGNTMRIEQNRLDTYSSWSKSDIITPRDLSRSGFYYIGPEDRVQCYFCKGILKNLATGDDPMTTHLRHFPECLFAANVITDNVPLNPNHRTPTFSAVLPRYEAKVPAMAIESARTSSFTHWPCHLYQRPDDLSKAGFFFTGSGDQARCFYCGGVLHNWSRDDDVWVEHARWFPGCGYLHQVKGTQFVNHVHDVARRKGEPSGSVRESASGRVSPRALKARMDLRIIKEVISMGHTRDVVKRAMEQHLRSTGDDFETAEQLINAVIEIELEDQFAVSEIRNEVRIEEFQVPTSSTSQLLNELPQRFNENSNVEYQATSPEDEVNPPENELIVDNSPIIDPNDDDLYSSDQELVNEPINTRSRDATQEGENVLTVGNEDQNIVDENRQLKEDKLCRICMDRNRDMVFIPCGHFVVCATCSFGCQVCPICRQKISGTVRVFQS